MNNTITTPRTSQWLYQCTLSGGPIDEKGWSLWGWEESVAGVWIPKGLSVTQQSSAVTAEDGPQGCEHE